MYGILTGWPTNIMTNFLVTEPRISVSLTIKCDIGLDTEPVQIHPSLKPISLRPVFMLSFKSPSHSS
jgi:hypothetical protein